MYKRPDHIKNQLKGITTEGTEGTGSAKRKYTIMLVEKSDSRYQGMSMGTGTMRENQEGEH